MTDRPVLRAGRLVQINHGGPRPVVFVAVGTAGDCEDLVGLEHARAWVLRIGAGTRKHVDIKAQYLARTVYRHARLDGIFARVDIGHKRFHGSAMNLTGRPSLIAAATVATSSP